MPVRPSHLFSLGTKVKVSIPIAQPESPEATKKCLVLRVCNMNDSGDESKRHKSGKRASSSSAPENMISQSSSSGGTLHVPMKRRTDYLPLPLAMVVAAHSSSGAPSPSQVFEDISLVGDDAKPLEPTRSASVLDKVKQTFASKFARAPWHRFTGSDVRDKVEQFTPRPHVPTAPLTMPETLRDELILAVTALNNANVRQDVVDEIVLNHKRVIAFMASGLTHLHPHAHKAFHQCTARQVHYSDAPAPETEQHPVFHRISEF